MATWLWMIFFLVFGTGMFLVGHYTGKVDAGENRAPNASSWVKVREIAAQTNKEIAMYEIDKQHEREKMLIERGVYDSVDPSIYRGENPDGD